MYMCVSVDQGEQLIAEDSLRDAAIFVFVYCGLFLLIQHRGQCS